MPTPLPPPPAPAAATLLVLDLGRMPACLALDAERTAELAHQAARLKYDMARVEIWGRIIFVAAQFDRAREAAHLVRLHGITHQPTLPPRSGIAPRTADTAQP